MGCFATYVLISYCLRDNKKRGMFDNNPNVCYHPIHLSNQLYIPSKYNTYGWRVGVYSSPSKINTSLHIYLYKHIHTNKRIGIQQQINQYTLRMISFVMIKPRLVVSVTLLRDILIIEVSTEDIMS